MQRQSFIAQTRLVKRQGVIPKVNVITAQFSLSLLLSEHNNTN